MKKHLLSLLIFFLLISFSFAQNKAGLSIQTRIGILGDAKNIEPTYQSFETTHDFNPGFNWAAGLNFQFFYSEKLGQRIGLLYESGQFTRIENYQYENFRGTIRSGENTRQYNNQSLLMPVQFLWQPGKVGLSFGIISNLHLKTKMDQERVFFEDGVETLRLQRNYESGTFVDYEFGDWEKFFIDKVMDFQWTIGIYFPISNRIMLDVEYKNLIGKNYLVRELHQYDVIGNVFDFFDAYGQNFSIGIYCKVK